jgi:choline dehydrogenase-like flavoprotein
MARLLDRGREQTQALSLEVDAVVVGLGAGGGMALRELARAGLRVVGLEDGDVTDPRSFTQREDSMLPRLFWDAGGRSTEDLAIRVLQGRGVGGSTVHNTNLCKRTPDEVLTLWQTRYGVDTSVAAMRPFFEETERALHVAPIRPDQLNGNNRVLERGAAALGWRSAVLSHNRVGCQESGFCELGCAYDAKENAAKILVPDAQDHGARVITDARVQEILFSKGRVTGVRGVLLSAEGKEHQRFEIQARMVILSASAVGSALLLRSSGVPDPYARAGKGLRIHPGAIVAGRFEQPVNAHLGIPQSYECTQHLSFEEGSPDRSWIIPAFAHPIGTAAMLPGFGAEHMRSMRLYKNLAVLTAMLHDETSGEVGVGESGRPAIDYRMSPTVQRSREAQKRAQSSYLLQALQKC